jgi:hypothetical protein
MAMNQDLWTSATIRPEAACWNPIRALLLELDTRLPSYCESLPQRQRTPAALPPPETFGIHLGKLTPPSRSGHGIDWPVWGAGLECARRVIEKLILVHPQHIQLVPEREIWRLRALTRTRVHRIEEITRVRNRISQLWRDRRHQGAPVATDLSGYSGRTMLKSLMEGQRGIRSGWPITRAVHWAANVKSCSGPWKEPSTISSAACCHRRDRT